MDDRPSLWDRLAGWLMAIAIRKDSQQRQQNPDLQDLVNRAQMYADQAAASAGKAESSAAQAEAALEAIKKQQPIPSSPPPSRGEG